MKEKLGYCRPDACPSVLFPEDLLCVSGTLEDIGDMDYFEW